ncbi:MAG: HlyD family efflux transporter periplasmic adaptor subunit [Sedimentisphaerales bacterium]|nr:HlyD family efflux transporter periplasmic adaptor subunit [Sedimentisphaerales bacterium]
MKKTVKKFAKWALICLPIALALIAVIYMVKHKPGPVRKQEQESIRTLRVIEAPSVNLIPRAVGYGLAEPRRIWEAVAEVKGRISSIHPRLKSGELIDAKSVLIQIDSTEYELIIARLEASVEESLAKIKELSDDDNNTKKLLEIEKRSLELAQKSLERKVGALEDAAISPDEVDREERAVLQQKQIVQQLENTLALIPTKRRALNAVLAAHQSNLKQSRIDLTKTTISSPYDCRLSEVNIEAGQFVQTGQRLFKAHGTDVTEVEARFQIEQLRNLLSEETRGRFQLGLKTDAFKQLFEDVYAYVSLQSGDWSAEWEAQIDRFRETVDLKTREMRVLVTVDRTYEKAVPGVRPPLTSGMFCRVELQGPARAASVVVPRSAVHDDQVFVIDQKDRLQTKQVVLDFAQSEFVVIKSGLSGGQMIVVSDPTPAIIGMKVLPVVDKSLEQYLSALSQGKRTKQ